jgi:hypothetical protein
MLGGLPVSRAGDSLVAVNPNGTLYMTLNSGSGSKYYPLNSAFSPATMPVYSKTYWQQNEPTFSKIKIAADTFAIATYSITGNNQTAPIDSYTIVKNNLTVGIGALEKRPGLRCTALNARLSKGASLVIEGLEGAARLEIFRVSGEKARDLGMNVFTGASQAVLMSKELPSGVYFLKITGAYNGVFTLVKH